MPKNRKLLLIPLFVLVLATAWFWRSGLIALASEIIDSFTTTDRVLDTWNVEVDTSAGEVKLEVRDCDSDDWICAQAEICPNAYGDGEYILVASTTIVGSKQWKLTQTACDLPQCGQDGGQDGDVLQADNTIDYVEYPAREACRQMGGRLPTIVELQCMYANRTAFNNNFGSAIYWSATEGSVTAARNLYFSDGNTSTYFKTNFYSVRCVRGW